MKKLLLILLCVPLLLSCGENDKTKKLEDRIDELETANKTKYVPEYTVSATIQIRDDNNIQVGAANLLEGLGLYKEENNYEDEIAKIQSYSLAEETITALGLDSSLTKEYRVKLEVSPLNADIPEESSILKLSIKGERDAITENIDYLKKLIEIYVRKGLEEKNLIAKNTRDFLSNRLDSVYGELILAEKEAKEIYINEKIIKDSRRMTELQIMRRVEVLNAIYLEISKNLEASKLTLVRNTPNIIVIDPPRLDSDTSINTL